MIKRKYLSEPEVQKLLSYIKSQADSARKRGTSRAVVDEIIVLLLIKAGLRSNELCVLQIQDLPIIHGGKSVWIRNTNEVVRKVSISNEVIELLTRFVTLYRKEANQQEPLLQSERGNPLGYMSLYSKLKRIGVKAGIGKLSPAILRHTYVTHLYDKEQDLRYVQDQAGYSSCRTLYKYVNNSDIETTRICEACGATIKKGRGKRIESGQLLCQTCQKYFNIK